MNSKFDDGARDVNNIGVTGPIIRELHVYTFFIERLVYFKHLSDLTLIFASSTATMKTAYRILTESTSVTDISTDSTGGTFVDIDAGINGIIPGVSIEARTFKIVRICI